MCKECYSENSRITPLLKPENCLQNHLQYRCSKCGRLICASVDKAGKYRAMFPFKSLDIAKLYLRVAEIITGSKCGIYEIIGNKGRKSYKIFASQEKLSEYLIKNKNKECRSLKPLYSSAAYLPLNKNQIISLNKEEITVYLKEQAVEVKKAGG